MTGLAGIRTRFAGFSPVPPTKWPIAGPIRPILVPRSTTPGIPATARQPKRGSPSGWGSLSVRSGWRTKLRSATPSRSGGGCLGLACLAPRVMLQRGMPEIAARERAEINRIRRADKGCFYARADRAGLIGTAGSLLLALCAPVALLFFPAAGPALGAAAGAWIFVTRFGLERLRREWQLKGACAQEEFDTEVLGIEWNDSLAHRLAPEEIRGAAGSLANEQEFKSWYPTEGHDSWPISVLI